MSELIKAIETALEYADRTNPRFYPTTDINGNPALLMQYLNRPIPNRTKPDPNNDYFEQMFEEMRQGSAWRNLEHSRRLEFVKTLKEIFIGLEIATGMTTSERLFITSPDRKLISEAIDYILKHPEYSFSRDIQRPDLVFESH